MPIPKHFTYDELHEQLTRKGRRHPENGLAIAGNTRAFLWNPSDPDGASDIHVRYHNSWVTVLHWDGVVDFSLAGWPTVTTRQRINSFLGPDFKLRQEKYRQLLDVHGYVNHDEGYDGQTLSLVIPPGSPWWVRCYPAREHATERALSITGGEQLDIPAFWLDTPRAWVTPARRDFVESSPTYRRLAWHNNLAR